MYERFTDRARKSLQLANQEAQRNNNEFVAPEHILLGVVKEGGGVAANVLERMGKPLNLGEVRTMLERAHPGVGDMLSMGRLPHTPKAKQVIEQAIAAATGLGDNYVGTEHLTLGLLAVESAAQTFLAEKGITACEFEKAVLEMLSGQDTKPAGSAIKELPPGLSEAFRLLVGVPSIGRKPATINTSKYWYAYTVTSDAGRVRHEFGADTLPELMALVEAKLPKRGV